MSDSVERLYDAVRAAKNADPDVSRTARLLRAGRGKMAKKLAEEAVEVVIDAMNGHTEAVVRESADLIYNLVVLWVSAGIHPRDVWAEMARREELLGIAEKMPKNVANKNFAGKHLGNKPPSAKNPTKDAADKTMVEPISRRALVGLDRRRLRKRR